jgi:hypothetical protein
MADSPTPEDAGDGVRGDRERESTGGTPRWVKVFGAIALLLVLLIGGLMLFGGGSHGPGRHLGGGDAPAGEAGRKAPPEGVPEQSGDHTGPPPGIEH